MKTIITHPNFSYLGEELVKQNSDIKIAKVRFEKFKDSWPNIFIENVNDDIEGNEITYIGDYSHPQELFTNYSIVRAIIGYQASKLRIIVPFFPVGTMERIQKKGEVATSRYMADILSHIPPARDSKASIHIFDIHTLEQRFFFDDFKVNTELHTAMDLIKEKIPKEGIIVFPDEGAKKRFGEDFLDYETFFASKKRVGDKREITLDISDLSGKDVFIIDDLIQSGGTIIETAKILRKKGAKTVNAFATHGVFVGDSIEKLTSELDNLYTTDTIPKNKTQNNNYSNLIVLDISEMIKRKILKIGI